MGIANLINIGVIFVSGIQEDLETIKVDLQSLITPAVFTLVWSVISIIAY